MEILLAIAGLAISFYLLAILVDDFFVGALDAISHKLKLAPDVAGATLMAVGSSAPELFTALISVLRPGEHADIGSGTIVGSAIFNILVIIGASAMFKKVQLAWQPVVRDTLFYVLSITVLLYAFRDGKVVMSEALIFVSLYVAYIVAVIYWKKILPYKSSDPVHIVDDVLNEAYEKRTLAGFTKKFLSLFIPDPGTKPNKYLITFLISIGLIGVLSFVLVESAVIIGAALNINTTIIALTVLAAGTSIPDLISSIVVARTGRGDMAVSNAIGSNIFDVLVGMGVPWVIVLAFSKSEIHVSTENLTSSVVLLFATVVAVFTLLIMRKFAIGRYAGFLLILLYVAYISYNIYEVIGV